MTKIMHF